MPKDYKTCGEPQVDDPFVTAKQTVICVLIAFRVGCLFAALNFILRTPVHVHASTVETSVQEGEAYLETAIFRATEYSDHGVIAGRVASFVKDHPNMQVLVVSESSLFPPQKFGTNKNVKNLPLDYGLANTYQGDPVSSDHSITALALIVSNSLAVVRDGLLMLRFPAAEIFKIVNVIRVGFSNLTCQKFDWDGAWRYTHYGNLQPGKICDAVTQFCDELQCPVPGYLKAPERQVQRCFPSVKEIFSFAHIKKSAPICRIRNRGKVVEHFFQVLNEGKVKGWLERFLLVEVQLENSMYADHIEVGIYLRDISRIEYLQRGGTDPESFVWEKALNNQCYIVSLSTIKKNNVLILPLQDENGSLWPDGWDLPHQREFPEWNLIPLRKISFGKTMFPAPNNANVFVDHKFGVRNVSRLHLKYGMRFLYSLNY